MSRIRQIEKFKDFANKNKLDFNDVVLDSSIILSVYGLREANDIDYFIDDNEKLKYNDEELEYHDEEKIEMIFNPKYHFYFNDIKFISFNQLYKMKKNRAEEKDRNDCKMMEALIENNGFKNLVNKWKQNFYYGKIKVKMNLIKFLKNIGLYEVIKRMVKGAK